MPLSFSLSVSVILRVSPPACGPRGHEEDGHPHVQRHIRHLPNGSHMCFWDDQEVYSHHLLGFLRTV
jgi:hypothetical protein